MEALTPIRGYGLDSMKSKLKDLERIARNVGLQINIKTQKQWEDNMSTKKIMLQDPPENNSDHQDVHYNGSISQPFHNNAGVSLHMFTFILDDIMSEVCLERRGIT